MPDIYEEAAQAIVEADREAAEEIAARALAAGITPARDHVTGLRQRHPGGR